MGFSLATSQASAAAPFCIGFAFRKGDIPAGQAVTGSIPHLQVTAKNRWLDGSLKFAVVAGRMALTANTSSTVTLAPGAASAGADLTLADLKATGVTASIGGGAYGNANWAAGDWDSPFQTWILGPEMSSWIYRKPVGSDAHLVAWLEVRLYAGGAVEVLPWIENGYVRLAGPTNKSATYTFTLGGAQRFSAAIDLKSHQRSPLVSGSTLSHWLGSDPAVTPRHDVLYLQETRLVPSYRASTPSSAAAVTSLPTAFAPLQQGSYPTGMGTAGYHPSIGMLPEWDVLYLTSTASNVWGALQRNAYSAGRYGIHFRDEATNRPIRFSQYPTMVLDGSSGISGTGASTASTYTTTQSGGAGPTYTNSHCPQFGYFAYLLTGHFYHLETAQFQATCHFLKNTDSAVARQGSAGILRSDVGANTTRGAAWSLRSLAMAAAITPDGDALQTELLNSLASNVNFYHSTYVAQANNPQGWVRPYSDYTVGGDNVYFEATWMQDFFTAAIGFAKSAGLPLPGATQTKLTDFFTWKAQSIVGRLGGTGANEFLFRDAAVYVVAVAPSDTANFDNGAGPWFSSWGALYNATYGTAGSGNVNPGARADGGLRGGNFPDASSYWGNLQPALAYAVEHGVPGAGDAYRRVVTASNWPSLAAGFDTSPVWSVRPPIEP